VSKDKAVPDYASQDLYKAPAAVTNVTGGLDRSSNQQERSSRPDPMVILERLIDKGVDIDKLKPMMDMVETYNRQRAAQEFADAITQFQGLMPAVDKKNPVYGKDQSKGPQYYYADFADIMEIARPHLKICGIVVTFDSEPVQAGLKATCRVRVGTHVESTTFTLPMPTIPNANGSQIAGAALQYAKRYAFCAALNISTRDDDDAQKCVEYLDEKQTAELNNMFDSCRKIGKDVNSQLFWDYIFGEDGTKRNMNDMTQKDFARAKWYLGQKIAQGKKVAKGIS
jgi:predicted nucleic-acid-binding protein